MIRTILIILVCGIVVIGGAYALDQYLWRTKYHVELSENDESMEPVEFWIPSVEELAKQHQSLTDRISFDLPLMEYPNKIRRLKDLTDQQGEKHTFLLFGSFT